VFTKSNPTNKKAVTLAVHARIFEIEETTIDGFAAEMREAWDMAHKGRNLIAKADALTAAIEMLTLAAGVDVNDVRQRAEASLRE
jgi:hypothetical protein